MKEITEVGHRSIQGVTRPFLCRAEDHQEYWVKGRYAGTRALCCEWVAGRLAQYMHLPVADFAILRVPEELIEHSFLPDINDLGAGLVFGSLNVNGARELGFGDIHRIPADVRLNVLAFDWWVANGDRTLGERGGNPNLLWAVGQDPSLRMIDHNLAFDSEFRSNVFFKSHVFSAERLQARKALLDAQARLSDAAGCARDLWHELPEEWLFVDSLQTVPTDFCLDDVERTLERLETCFLQDWMMQP